MRALRSSLNSQLAGRKSARAVGKSARSPHARRTRLSVVSECEWWGGGRKEPPHRPFSRRSAVFGCAPARLNWPVSRGVRHADWSWRRARSLSATPVSSSHWTSCVVPKRTASNRSGRTNCTAPAQSSPTLADLRTRLSFLNFDEPKSAYTDFVGEG